MELKVHDLDNNGPRVMREPECKTLKGLYK